MPRPQQMAAHPEEILDNAVDGGEALQMHRRLEAPHLVFTLTRRLVRHLGSVVRVLICTAPGSLDTYLCYAAWRSSYSSRASIGV